MSKQTFVAFGVASTIAFATLSISIPASAQMGRGGGYGPGMMDGQGYGPGMMGPGYGPGMMGNYGPGMMGGCPMMGSTTDGQVSTFAEGRIAFLKAELGITDAQKGRMGCLRGEDQGQSAKHAGHVADDEDRVRRQDAGGSP